MFQGRRLLIATKHKKEVTLAPILESELGVQCITAENFDTDIFGTFSGEIDRKDDPVSTARKKCLSAMHSSGCDLVVASEGSFGPHPQLFFVPADDELIVLLDKKNRIEIIARELSTNTNYNQEKVVTEKQLLDFAQRVKFPSHGLIVRKAKNDYSGIRKGITDITELKRAFKHFFQSSRSAYVETDMRAMYNPTRMSVIESTAFQLVEKVKSTCPNCSWCGFWITEVKAGLPCSWCGNPTRSIQSHTYACLKCKYAKEVVHPGGKTNEDPMYCDNCNP